MDLTEKQAAQLVNAVKGFIDRKLAPVETEVDGLKAREEMHHQTIEALMRRMAALERKLGQKSGGAVRLIRAGE